MSLPTATSSDTAAWWASRRRQYNLWLVGAGVIGFVLYSLVIQFACRCDPEAEITLFTMIVQAVGYLVAMAVANLFYSLGAVVERIVKPRDVSRFRLMAYRAGVAFSAALPLLVAVLAYLGCGCGETGRVAAAMSWPMPGS